MGIAWFDDVPPPMEEPALRTGGLPLMAEGDSWPDCPRCELPMLFRAQLPLAVTSLVAPDDPRLLLLFECHAVDEEGCTCDGSEVRIVDASRKLAPLEPPAACAFDVMLLDVGERAAEVMRIASALSDRELDLSATKLPLALLRAAPASIAQETVRTVCDAGGSAQTLPCPPTTLPMMHGGKLVPFDDAMTGVRKTTLPPLGELMTQANRGKMRGLLGGSTPGYRDHSIQCSCGSPSRTAVRMLATQGPYSLEPSVVQVCLRCNSASAFRTHSAPLAYDPVVVVGA